MQLHQTVVRHFPTKGDSGFESIAAGAISGNGALARNATQASEPRLKIRISHSNPSANQMHKIWAEVMPRCHPHSK
jgi:hypothetical protein